MKPTRVGPKFQVVIPAEVRRQAGLAPGDLVLAEAAPDGAIVLRKKNLADPFPRTPPETSTAAPSRQQAGKSEVRKRLGRRHPDQNENATLEGDDVLPILKRYSEGRLTCDEAVKRLGVDYGTLLVMLSKAKLPWPRLPRDQRARMAKEFVELLRGAGPE